LLGSVLWVAKVLVKEPDRARNRVEHPLALQDIGDVLLHAIAVARHIEGPGVGTRLAVAAPGAGFVGAVKARRGRGEVAPLQRDELDVLAPGKARVVAVPVGHRLEAGVRGALVDLVEGVDQLGLGGELALDELAVLLGVALDVARVDELVVLALDVGARYRQARNLLEGLHERGRAGAADREDAELARHLRRSRSCGVSYSVGRSRTARIWYTARDMPGNFPPP